MVLQGAAGKYRGPGRVRGSCKHLVSHPLHPPPYPGLRLTRLTGATRAAGGDAVGSQRARDHARAAARAVEVDPELLHVRVGGRPKRRSAARPGAGPLPLRSTRLYRPSERSAQYPNMPLHICRACAAAELLLLVGGGGGEVVVRWCHGGDLLALTEAEIRLRH